jgi:hypothetical protein
MYTTTFQINYSRYFRHNCSRCSFITDKNYFFKAKRTTIHGHKLFISLNMHHIEKIFRTEAVDLNYIHILCDALIFIQERRKIINSYLNIMQRNDYV